MSNLKSYLLEDAETSLLKSVVSTLHSYNGSFNNLIVEDNDEEFFNQNFSNNPFEAVRASFYGDYNFNHEYVRINDAGNLDSYNEVDYENLLVDNIDDIISEIISQKDYVDFGDVELDELAEKWESTQL